MKISLPFFLVFLSVAHVSLGQQTICYGDVETYSVDKDEGAGMGTEDSFYAWTVEGSGYVGEIILPEAGNTNEIVVDWGGTPPGNYVVLVEEFNNGCFGEERRLEVTILPIPISKLIPGFICKDPTTGEIMDAALLDTGLSETLFSFEWYFEDEVLAHTEPSLTADQIGTYGVLVTNKESGCRVFDSTTVGFSSFAIAEVFVRPDFGDIQRISIPIVQGLGEYEYSLDGGEFQDGPEFLVTEAGAYTVTVRDKNGCGAIDLVANVLTFPKFFTPNGDGYNDFWNIDGSLPIMEADVFIYDRYGTLIMRMDGLGRGWDGTYNGKPLPSDDYWFVVDYINALGMDAVYKSHFALRR